MICIIRPLPFAIGVHSKRGAHLSSANGPGELPHWCTWNITASSLRRYGPLLSAISTLEANCSSKSATSSNGHYGIQNGRRTCGLLQGCGGKLSALRCVLIDCLESLTSMILRVKMTVNIPSTMNRYLPDPEGVPEPNSQASSRKAPCPRSESFIVLPGLNIPLHQHASRRSQVAVGLPFICVGFFG